MTTIVCDGKVMVSDGHAVGDYIDSEPFKKLRKVRKHIIGLAGHCTVCERFVEWFKEGCPMGQDIPGDYQAIVLAPDGTVTYYESGPVIPLNVGLPVAIGSGSGFALGAMDAGATPRQAVKIACKRDPMSGGRLAEKRI